MNRALSPTLAIAAHALSIRDRRLSRGLGLVLAAGASLALWAGLLSLAFLVLG